MVDKAVDKVVGKAVDKVANYSVAGTTAGRKALEIVSDGIPGQQEAPSLL